VYKYLIKLQVQR